MLVGSNWVTGGQVPGEVLGTCSDAGSAGRSPTAAEGPAGTAGTSQGCRSNKIPPGSCLDGTAAEALPREARAANTQQRGQGQPGGGQAKPQAQHHQIRFGERTLTGLCQPMAQEGPTTCTPQQRPLPRDRA